MPQKNTKTAPRRRQVCYNSSSVAAVRLCWEGITTEKVKAFLKRKDIVISVRRYGIDALGAMAQGLFCSLLIGTIIDTVGAQFGIPFLTMPVATVSDVSYTVGGLASAMSGPSMAVAIGYALRCPPLVLFSLITVGFASNALGAAAMQVGSLIMWATKERRDR